MEFCESVTICKGKPSLSTVANLTLALYTVVGPRRHKANDKTRGVVRHAKAGISSSVYSYPYTQTRKRTVAV